MKIFNSNRTGHVTAAIAVGCSLAGGAIVLNLPWQFFVTAATIPLWELWGTCDNDVNSRSLKKGRWYRRFWVWWWKDYALTVAHRSRFSHSIIPGTIIRLIVSGWVFFLICKPGLLIALPVLAGCVIADCVHMLKDGYWPQEILFGR